jgi:protein-tyrosine-phosphatase/DNA-binding HxlR family transcriptional regulator
MNIERTDELQRRARAYAALGDPTRLAIVDRLATGDASASELGHALGVSSNLLAHHVRTLQNAGLVTRRPSEGDARRSYLSLNVHEEWLLHPDAGGAGKVPARRVLFVCTANTARSHLAAATWRRLSTVPAESAGTHPGETIDPHARDAAKRHALDLPNVAPRSIGDTIRDHDLVITVCDRAHEELEGRDWAHWSIPDPVPLGTDSAFDAVLTDLADRIRRVVPLVVT